MPEVTATKPGDGDKTSRVTSRRGKAELGGKGMVGECPPPALIPPLIEPLGRKEARSLPHHEETSYIQPTQETTVGRVKPSGHNLTIGGRIKQGLRAIGFSILVGSQVLAASPAAAVERPLGDRPKAASIVQTPARIHTSKLQNCLNSFLAQDKILSFYDYQRAKPLNLSAINPSRINVPTDAWPLDREKGLGAFISSIKAIHKIIDDPNTRIEERTAIFEGVNKLIREHPFLQYQAFYYSKDGKLDGIPNNIFTQFMSRRLMLLALESTPGLNPEEEKKLLVDSLFPKTVNGQTGARLFEKHGVLLAGFGVQADTNRQSFNKVNVQAGWKAANGSTHSGGIFDYPYFTEESIKEVEHLLDMYPRHLCQVGSQKPVSITAHGYYYIYEMEDFASRYYPQDAGIRNLLGYLHGQTLNVFGLRTINFKDSVEDVSFRERSMSGQTTLARPAHPQLVILGHEIAHLSHAIIAVRRPDLQKKLEGIIALGVREKSSVRAIDCDLNNFGGSNTPAYSWFSKCPQEAVATLANVAYLDPTAVLKWSVALATERSPKIQPINHLLWLLNANSLDPQFKETDKTFLLTLQPRGVRYEKIEFDLKRDDQGRIKAVHWNNGDIEFTYGGDGFARVVKSSFLNN